MTADPGPAASSDGDRAGRARSFGSAAADYARTRTGYAVDDVVWALRGHGAADPAPAGGRWRVLDLAAGTGRLGTAVLAAAAERSLTVSLTAVEPDARMRAALADAVGPATPVLDGTAESVPLPDAAFDAVLVGSAFHWFDPARALPEIARVLAPGGVLAALWTGPDEDTAWVAAYRDAGRAVLADPGERAAGGRTGAGASARDRSREAAFRDIPASPLFTATEQRSSGHVEAMARDGLATGIGTYSSALVAPPGRRAAAVAAAAETLARGVPDEAVLPDGRVALPVRVRAARCRVR